MVPPHVANCRDPHDGNVCHGGDKRPSRKVARHADAASGLRGFHRRTVLSSPCEQVAARSIQSEAQDRTSVTEKRARIDPRTRTRCAGLEFLGANLAWIQV